MIVKYHFRKRRFQHFQQHVDYKINKSKNELLIKQNLRKRFGQNPTSLYLRNFSHHYKRTPNALSPINQQFSNREKLRKCF